MSDVKTGTAKPYKAPEPDVVKKAPPTPAELEAQKAADAGLKVEHEAQTKAGKINTNLVRDGNPGRIMAQSRRGKERYFWGHFVPTRELTDEELGAVEKVK